MASVAVNRCVTSTGASSLTGVPVDGRYGGQSLWSSHLALPSDDFGGQAIGAGDHWGLGSGVHIEE